MPGISILPLGTPQSGSFANTQDDALDLSDLGIGERRPSVRDANLRLLEEKVDLVSVAKLWVNGIMPHEIAEVMKISEVKLEELLRSTEFAEEVQAALATKRVLSLDKALESSAVEALLQMRDLMKNSGNEQVKFKAASYLIDQHRGRAPQHIQLSGGKHIEDPKSEIERLERKLMGNKS